MSVYDKELIIDGKVVRSPEQQVYKNMKDIKALQEVIKPEYTTNAVLTSSSVSVAIADTNAPEGTTEGWLITQDGLKFKITGGDETNLLLEFYCSIQGPQGEQGPEGPEGSTSGLITFTNIAVDDADFTSSTEYTDYGYECVVLQSDDLIGKTVNGGMVTFDVAEADSSNYASICNVDTTTGEITIYAKAVPSGDFTIPSIWLIVE